MPTHIFYSWQSDMDSACGKNLVKRALSDAVAQLNKDADVEAAEREPRDEQLALDHDTSGEPGSPPIVDTIFGKIDRAAAFVSDLTYVAKRADGRRMPNPNVLLEHGWALKSLTWRGVISVMNIAHGHPKDHPLPFDLRHSLGPIFFECPDGADDAAKAKARHDLTKALVRRLRATLDNAELRDVRRGPSFEPHPHDISLIERWKTFLGDPLRQFLRNHEFAEPYRRKLIDPLHEMDTQWLGAQYELDDRELEEAFRSFHGNNRAFCTLLAERTRALPHDGELASAKTDLDAKFGLQVHTRESIALLNHAARALNDAVDGVDRAVRVRIRAVIEPRPLAPDPRCDLAFAKIGELATDRLRGGVPRIVSRPRMTLRLAPFAAFDGKRLDAGAVARVQRSFSPDPLAPIEEGSDGRQWWTCAKPEPRPGLNPETVWLTRLVRPGLLETEVMIGSAASDGLRIAIDGEQLERAIIFRLEQLAATLPTLGLEGPGLIEISFDELANVDLHRGNSVGRQVRRQELYLPMVTVDDLSTPLAMHFREGFDILWQTADWREGSPSFTEAGWAGYRENQ